MLRALVERGTKIRWIRYHMLSYRNGRPYQIGEKWVRTGETTFIFGGGKYDAWEQGWETDGKLHCLVDINKKEPLNLDFTTSKGGIDPTRYKTETDNKILKGIILGGKESILPWIIAVMSIVAIIAVTYILTNNLKVIQPITTITPPIKVG